MSMIKINGTHYNVIEQRKAAHGYVDLLVGCGDAPQLCISAPQQWWEAGWCNGRSRTILVGGNKLSIVDPSIKILE